MTTDNSPSGSGAALGTGPGTGSANIVETTDAAGNTSTAYTIGVGQTAEGQLSTIGDHDWYRVNLIAGQTYTFAMSGSGTNNVIDTYLRLYASNGTTLLASNDDGLPANNSIFTYTASTTGTYYVDAAGYDGSDVGQYGIAVTSGTKASLDVLMGAGVIDTDYSWSSTPGTGVTVTYGFRANAASYTVSGSNIASFSQFSAAEIAAAESALQFWSDVCNIHYTRVNPSGYTDNASILFGNYNDSTDGAGAFAFYPGATASNDEAGDVWANTDSVSTSSLPVGGYSYFALMHEIGHTLGLSHPGLYNAAPGVSITYAKDAQFIQDSQQYTVMSYFDASDTGSNLGGYPDTPMLLDIYAAQRIYGANMSTRTGDTIYGFGSNAGAIYNFSSNTSPGLCIWDAGGSDALDCSGYSQNQLIDLNAGDFSNVGGLSKNVSIALGATIENAIGGSGADTLIGNDVNNTLTGKGGNDSLMGDGAFDTAVYSKNRASYVVTRNGLNTTISGPDGTDTLSSIELLKFADGAMPLINNFCDFNDDLNSDVLWRNNATGDIGFYQINNGVVAGWHGIGGSSSAFSAAGLGDFNGDGTSDILLWNSATGTVGYDQIANGALVGWHGLGNASTAYSVAGVGDFNGDSVSDILWRNNSTGDTGYYQMNSDGSLLGWHGVGGSSTAYGVVGIGDFNDDGVSDILFRNDQTGDTGYYQMNSNGDLQKWNSVSGSSTAYKVVGVGDFNGDGVSDILFRNNQTGDTGFYQMNSDGTLQGWHTIGGSSTAYKVAAIGDYNGDGTSDVLFANSTTGDSGFYQMSNGGLAGWHSIGGSSPAYAVVA